MFIILYFLQIKTYFYKNKIFFITFYFFYYIFLFLLLLLIFVFVLKIEFITDKSIVFMIKGVGIDIIEVSRIREDILKYNDKFLRYIYTDEEIKYCESFNDLKNSKFIHYAGRFAAKEAFSKAIGTGISNIFKFRDISIINNENGMPIIKLSGELFNQFSKFRCHISLSHTCDNAAAYVIIEE